MADHTVTCHPNEVSANLLDDYNFMVIGSWAKRLHRQVEEALRNAMTRGFLMLGRGKRRKKMLLKQQIFNRKFEFYPPCFLALGGGMDRGISQLVLCSY